MKIDARQVSALVAVIEEQSFDRAAMRLNLTQSAVSQRIKQLENLLGHALLVRTNPPQPTAMGTKLLTYYQQVSILESELLQQLGWLEDGEQQYKLAIGVNADSLSTWFFDAVQEFVEKHDLLLDLKVDDQDQTYHMLKNGDVVGCISTLDSAMPGCHIELLGDMTYYCVCSPDFEKRFFEKGANKQAFLKAPAVQFNHKDLLQADYLQRYWGIQPFEYLYHQVPASEPYLDYMVRGMAWGMAPPIQCQQLLDSGELVELTPDKVISVKLYWHVWNLKSSLVRELTQVLRIKAKKLLR